MNRTHLRLIVGVGSLVAAFWCLHAAARTATLLTGPTTPDQLERLRASATWIMRGFALFTGLAIVSAARLTKRLLRGRAAFPRGPG